MTRRRWSYNNSPLNNFSKKIKDYIIPIIWWILILFLIWSFFFKTKAEKPKIETWSELTIEKWVDWEGLIIYSGGKKEDLKNIWKLYRTERLKVSNGTVKLLNQNVSFNLKKLWDLKYLENGDFSIDSWEIWVNSDSTTNVDMKFAKLKIHPNSHVSLSQNEVSSTVNVVSWKVEVANLVWKNTILSDKEKLEIARAEASDSKVDFSLKKEPLWDYFLKSDWFILNDGEKYIWTWNVEETSSWTATGSASTWKIDKETIRNSWKSKYLVFSNLLDESNVSSDNISISGSYIVDEVAKIDVNWKEAKLNSESGTFKVEWISVPEKTNDIVFKIFDANEELKEKFVYTVYYEWASQSSTNSENPISSSAKNFDIDGSKFTFTAPISGTTYTTYEDFVTIRWSVKALNIDKVEVNGLKLSSFNGKTWRYHATTDYWNLLNWTNLYEIKYFSKWELVYKNYYTIIKKTWVQPAVQTENTQVKNNKNNNSKKEENTEETEKTDEKSWTWSVEN